MFLLLGISGGYHQVAAAASTAVGIGERLMTTRQLPTDPLGVVAAATAAAFGEARTSSSDLLLPNSSVSLDQCNSGSEI